MALAEEAPGFVVGAGVGVDGGFGEDGLLMIESTFLAKEWALSMARFLMRFKSDIVAHRRTHGTEIRVSSDLFRISTRGKYECEV
jgi:hypothetical protein